LNYPGKFDVKLPVDAKLPGDGLGAHSHGHDIVSSPHAPSDAIIVSDPNLLLNGDFRRSGVDLIVSKDDREPVLQDYFRSGALRFRLQMVRISPTILSMR
jgi:hypothetical protein